MFDDCLFVHDGMNDREKRLAVEKFTNSFKSIVLVVGPRTIDVKCDVAIVVGCPSPKLELPPSSHVLIRNNEFDSFKKNICKFSPYSIPNGDEAMLMFARRLLNDTRPAGETDTSKDMTSQETVISPKKISDLIRMHGIEFVTGLVSMARLANVGIDKVPSPLSGESGFSAILLHDPFHKKIRTHEMCHKLVADALKRSVGGDIRDSIGRIALSEKGFVVDVLTEYVSSLMNSRRLRARNIQPIYLKELPRIVDRDKSFVLKQFVKDKKLLSRMMRRSRK
jgi:hypothetical protein